MQADLQMRWAASWLAVYLVPFSTHEIKYSYKGRLPLSYSPSRGLSLRLQVSAPWLEWTCVVSQPRWCADCYWENHASVLSTTAIVCCCRRDLNEVINWSVDRALQTNLCSQLVCLSPFCQEPTATFGFGGWACPWPDFAIPSPGDQSLSSASSSQLINSPLMPSWNTAFWG